MNCPDCNLPLDEITPNMFECEKCEEFWQKCSCCDYLSFEMESDICGHSSCVEKKAERMFK